MLQHRARNGLAVGRHLEPSRKVCSCLVTTTDLASGDARCPACRGLGVYLLPLLPCQLLLLLLHLELRRLQPVALGRLALAWTLLLSTVGGGGVDGGGDGRRGWRRRTQPVAALPDVLDPGLAMRPAATRPRLPGINAFSNLLMQGQI